MYDILLEMNFVKDTKKQIAIILILFLFLYISLAPTISNSVESVLISRARVHGQTHSLPLSPLIGSERYSDVEEIPELQIQDLEQSGTSRGVITSDPRITAMRQFLIDYNSPMYPHADVLVREADRHGLDWRLVAAISGVESAFGNLIPHQSNNAWGWRGDPTRDWSHFRSWEDGIETVSEGIARVYGTEMTPFDMEPIYCPQCGENPDSLWANGVIKFKEQLDMYLEGR